jgi:hypothetical protein
MEPADVTMLRFTVDTKVFVRDRYLGNWCSGFAVAEVLDDGYRLRRLSDGRVFPDLFPFDDVFLERRRTLREVDDRIVMNRERRLFP